MPSGYTRRGAHKWAMLARYDLGRETSGYTYMYTYCICDIKKVALRLALLVRGYKYKKI
jgi:hypothetical protein